MTGRGQIRRALTVALDDIGVTAEARQIEQVADRLDELLACEACDGGTGRWEFHFIDDKPVSVVIEKCGKCGGSGVAT